MLQNQTPTTSPTIKGKLLLLFCYDQRKIVVGKTTIDAVALNIQTIAGGTNGALALLVLAEIAALVCIIVSSCTNSSSREQNNNTNNNQNNDDAVVDV